MTPHPYRLKEQNSGVKIAASENKFLVPFWLLLKISNFTCIVVKRTFKKCLSTIPSVSF